MAVVPRSPLAKIEFYESHGVAWQTNATNIGLTTTEVDDLANLAADARSAYQDQQGALLAARATTAAYHTAVANMQAKGAALLKKIKAKAAMSGPSVYALAQIPAPAAPGPVPPPGTPTSFKIQLLQNGALVLNWKCSNPVGATGTIYEVRRRNSPSSPFQYVGATGPRSFTDETIPAGSTQVTYEITAVRSTLRGNPAEFNVNFGKSETGEMSVRLAA